MLGYAIYAIIDNYICLGYLGLLQYNLYKHDNNFGITKFNDLSGMVIPEMFMNVMSCHGFSKSPISTIILSCSSALVPYHLNNGFVIVET